MISSLFVLFAAAAASSSNLMIRMGLNPGKSINGFLAIFYFVSMLFSIATFADVFSTSPLNPMALAGALQGVVAVILTQFTAKAMKNGPSGLTFAFRNASAVFPPLILFLFFGPAFGFIITPIQLLGMLLVVAGLLIASQNKPATEEKSIPRIWFFYAIGCFLLQGIASTLIQWRCFLFAEGLPSHFLIPFSCSEVLDGWFMPTGFATAGVLQLMLFLKEKAAWDVKELYLGALGGFLNGVCGFFLIWATKWANSIEKIVLFPLFAVLIIILCNLWGRFIYKEPINIFGNILCCLGIFITAFGY